MASQDADAMLRHRRLGEPVETRDQVARIARFTAKAIGLERDLRDDEIVLDDRYHAGTYGIPDASTLDAMRLAARLEAMITDEGNSMAGLIDPVSRAARSTAPRPFLRPPRGQPAINAYPSLFSCVNVRLEVVLRDKLSCFVNSRSSVQI